VRSLKRYFEYYNTDRPHQSLGRRTPAEAYDAGLRISEAA
jgi:putative transposase